MQWFSLDYVIEFLKYVLMHLSAEKLRSELEVVIGIVKYILRSLSLTSSQNFDCLKHQPVE